MRYSWILFSFLVPLWTGGAVRSDEPDGTPAPAEAFVAQAAGPERPRSAGEPEPERPAPAAEDDPLGEAERQRVEVADVVVEGELFDADPETGLLYVTGEPRASRGMDEIRGLRLIINPRTREFIAEGNVTLRQGIQEWAASRIAYNFDTQQGRAEFAHSLMHGYFVDAEEVRIEPGPVYHARRVHFTTCDRERRHYDLYSRQLQLTPGDRLVAEGAALDLFGIRLVTVPRFSRSLSQRDESEQSLYPTLGYGGRDGFYAEKDYRILDQAPVWLDLNGRINSRRDPSGGLLASTTGDIQVVAALFYRDIAENQRVPQLQVSRLPEVGLLWAPRERPRPGKFLPHQVPGVRRPDYLERSRAWRLSAELTAGYFKQHRGIRIDRLNSETKSHGRVAMQVQGILPVVQLGPLEFNDLRVMARQSFYDSGDEFSVLGVGLGKQVEFGRVRVRLDRFDQFTRGNTPFLFDNVELRQEWRPQFEYRGRDLNFSYFARIRGQTGELFDQVFSISKVIHCIEPRFTYRVRRSEFGLDIRIPGLTSFRRSPIGEPRTIDTGDDPPVRE